MHEKSGLVDHDATLERPLTVCAILPLRLPSPRQVRGFVFYCDHCSSLFTAQFNRTQTLEIFLRLDLTTHVNHGFPTKSKICISADWHVAFKCILPTKMPVPSLFSIKMRSLFTELLDLSSTVRSQMLVHTSMIYIQESCLNSHVAGAVISIQVFGPYRWWGHTKFPPSQFIHIHFLTLTVWPINIILSYDEPVHKLIIRLFQFLPAFAGPIAGW